MIIATYATYVTLSILLTVWVATALFRNGRVFLVESFRNEAMADSVNKLLVVGFYLVNVGFVSLFLRFGSKPENAIQAFEYVATKIGVVLLVLGAWHFLNIMNFAKIYRKGRAKKELEAFETAEAIHVAD